MRKIQLFVLSVVVVLFTACHDKIWDSIEDLDSRVTKLEELCKEMNTNISALQTIVSVIQENDFITGIVPIEKGGEVIGYTIMFGKHDPITIYNGEDGKDGQNGSGSTPIIGVAKDTDGVYYWTLNGEWLLDDEGNKLPVSGKNGNDGENGEGSEGESGTVAKDGVTPQLKIENGYWYVSYDNGATWTELGKAVGEDGEKGDKGDKGDAGEKGDKGDSMFQSITEDDTYVYFTLADGTIIKIIKQNNSIEQPDSEFMFIVTYDANGGEGEMLPDTFYYGVLKTLKPNLFTINTNKIYIEWNTRADGKGVSYKENQEVVINKNIKLYAIWKVVRDDKFSVADDKQVFFSMGNLQYCPKTRTWRFAENQYDFIGEKNTYISLSYNGWIDLFGWGTGNNPTLNMRDPENYEVFYDWGINKIGDDPEYTWRTLKSSEWSYLLKKRANASNLYVLAQIEEIKGLIILPDNWIAPHGFSLKPSQIFTLEQWKIMELAGAIFLPAAGYRAGVTSTTGVFDFITSKNIYWSASRSSSAVGSDLTFSGSVAVGNNNNGVWNGASVRLVKDVE